MAFFGYDTKGDNSTTINSMIKGTKYTCPVNCKGVSITAWITSPAAVGRKAKCALYTSVEPELTLIGSTEEITFPAEGFDNWQTFNFIAQPDLTALTDYFIVAWGFGALNIYYNALASRLAYDTLAYNDWVSPLVFFFADNYKCSIYCTYEVAGAPKGGSMAAKLVAGKLI